MKKIIPLFILFISFSSVSLAGDYEHTIPFQWINPQNVSRVVIYEWVYEKQEVNGKLTHWFPVWDSINSTFVSGCVFCTFYLSFFQLDWFEFFAIQGQDKDGKQIFWDEFTHVRVPKGGD